MLVLVSNVKYYFPFTFTENGIDNINDINLGFFGDSHLYSGIITEKINSSNYKSINFSEPSSPLFFTIKRINRVLKINPKIDVVVDVGSNNLTNNGTVLYLNENFSESGYRANIINSSFLLNLDDLKLILGIKSLSYFFRGVFFNFSFIVNKPKYNLCKNTKIKKKNEQLNKEYQNLKITNDFELSELDKLIKKHSQTKFILIIPPEKKEYSDRYDQNRVNQKILQLSLNKNVIFKDFRSNDYDNSMFFDESHLCYDGALKFTEDFIDFYRCSISKVNIFSNNHLYPTKSYPTKLLPNLSQTLPVVPLPIKGSNTNSNSLDV